MKGKITPLWVPDEGKQTQMDAFRRHINKKYQLSLPDYEALYRWSTDEIALFWKEIWGYFSVIHSEGPCEIVDDVSKMPGATWFRDARLNFAENLLRCREDRPAIISVSERTSPCYISFKSLYDDVSRVEAGLSQLGVNTHDVVAGIVLNTTQTTLAMLASASLGAIWTACSPEFGLTSIVDRLSQTQPKVLFAHQGSTYAGKRSDNREKIDKILEHVPSIQTVIWIPEPNSKAIDTHALDKHEIPFSKLMAYPAGALTAVQLPFDHPLYILYSSGTTGKPKCIVHSVGGTLLQHIKEHRLHCDLGPQDRLFYFTTCAWMMWNWLVSALAGGTTIVLYDGAPQYPSPDQLWRLSEDLEVTVFGTSASYISMCQKKSLALKNKFAFKKLKMILSTGSPLTEELFEYVYNEVSSSSLLGSMSGGTDIVSCFALSNPTLPVYSGEIQCRGLGMAVDTVNEKGESLVNRKGELVCRKPFPSMPIGFWGEDGQKRYHDAYFETMKGVWFHGDYSLLTERGGVIIFGRSDTTLNPGGVRIGSAELYRVLDHITAILDSIVVSAERGQGEQIVLFVKLQPSLCLDDGLIRSIQKRIRNDCSPRHVPKEIFQVNDIPYTLSGKKVEKAVKDILEGRAVLNRSVLRNPESLDEFKR